MSRLKIAISGKGGVGKSTVAAVWARLLAQRGEEVLAIDADPDANLASALGVPASLQERIKPISRDETLVEERTGAKPGKTGQMFMLNPHVSDLASRYAVKYSGVDLLVLGAIKKGGGGCACPENTLLRSLVRHLVLNENETVILDMEAGVEHLGRATASGVDALVVVTEPGARSLETAVHIQKLARDIGLQGKMLVVMNKVRDQNHELSNLNKHLPGCKVLGGIPFDNRFIESDEQGVSILDLHGSFDLVASFKESLDNLLLTVKK